MEEEKGILQGLTKKEQARLERVAGSRTVRKQEAVFLAGNRIEYLYILLQGQIAIQEESEDGNRHLVTVISQEKDTFGEVYVFVEEPVPLSAVAMKESKILMIPKQELCHFPSISANLNKILANKACKLTAKLQLLMRDTLREKILQYLKSHDDVVLKRHEMADYLGVSRPALSREIGKLQDEGVIYLTEKGELRVRAEE